MTNHNQTTGEIGEKLAWDFLRKNGYKILDKNFSTKLGEIDIIAREGKTTVFIEVKARRTAAFGLPSEAVTKKKIRHLRRAAQYYIKTHNRPEEYFRFDVVSILLGTKTEIQLIKNAF